MAKKLVRQTTFNSGELDPIVWKRTDASEEYLSGAQSLQNMEVGTTGLCKKRLGTSLLYNATGYAQFNSHMYEFVDKFNNYYVLLSAGGYFYVFASASSQVQVVDHLGNFLINYASFDVVAFAGNLTFVQAIPTPYQDGDLDEIDYTQDNDALIVTHPNFPPGRIYISQYNGSAFPTFAYQPLDIYPLPSYDFNTINYNGFTVSLSVTGNILTFEFTGVGANPGYDNAWVGGQIIGGGVSDVDPIGYAIITAVSYSAAGGGTVTFTALVQIPFQTSGYATQGSQYSIRQPAWSAALGYPAKVLFFQNRLWLANTQALNNAIFGSKINAPINFDVGTGRDTDAIVYILGQTSSGGILWMNGGKQLEIYCQNYEFACPQDQNVALTPATFSVRQQSSYGSSPNLKPITYINDSYFAAKTGKAFINFHFNGIGLSYASSNISAASSHLVKNPTNRALLRGSDTSQDNFIYFINPTDDTLTSFQFSTEYKLAALSPIVFQENVELIDICTINNQIYLLKFYNLTEQYTIEVLDPTTRIDCNTTASMNSSGLVSGLSLYNGYTIQVVYKGQDFGQYLVSGGQITVYNPQQISDNVMIGFLYDVEIQTMYVFSESSQSAMKKQIQRIYVDYYESLNFYIEGTFVPYMTYTDIQNGVSLAPQTGTAIINPVTGYNRFYSFSITQSSPFDLQILSIAYEIKSGLI